MGVYGGLNILKTGYITKVLTELPDNTNLIGQSLCPMETSDLQKIVIDYVESTFGMTQPVAMNSASPLAPAKGMYQRTFKPAFWREKIRFDEEEILTLRQPGTEGKRWGKGQVQDAVQQLDSRLQTRIEWLIWQMFGGTITINENGVSFAINYNIAFSVQAATSWATVASADPLSDITNWVQKFRGTGIKADTLYVNSIVDRYLLLNNKIRTLLRYQTGRKEDLVSAGQLKELIGKQFSGLKYEVYTSGYHMRSSLTADAASGQAVVNVQDGSQFVAGDVCRLLNTDTTNGHYQEEVTVLSVSSNAVTMTGNLTSTFYKGARMDTFKPFIGDTLAFIMGKRGDGQPIANCVTTPSPYGATLLNPKPGKFGRSYDKSDEDPPHVDVLAGIYMLPRLNFIDNHIKCTVVF